MDRNFHQSDSVGPASAPDLLTLSEEMLLKLADDISDPLTEGSHGGLYAALIGMRARSLYQNFLHALGSPALIGPILALRPLVEATILAKWISLEPALHGELWFAQAEDRELTAVRQIEQHFGIRVRGEISADRIRESVEQKAVRRDAAIRGAKAAGKRYGKRAMPSLADMVGEIENKDPGHRVAMRQAYELAYRGFSPWMHTEASSFKATVADDEEGLRFLGDLSPYNPEHLRMIAAAMFAYTLELIGLEKRDGSEVLARVIRNYVTMIHGAS